MILHAARRQAALAPGRRRPQRVVAAGAVAAARRSPQRAHEAGDRRLAAPLPRARLERRRRPGRRRPVGPRRCAPPTATCPSSCSATRWERAWRSTWPTTPRCAAWSGWLRGGRPSDPVATLAGRTPASPPTDVATGSRRSRETSRYVERARAVAESAELHDMGALGPLHADRLARAGTTSRPSQPRRARRHVPRRR